MASIDSFITIKFDPADRELLERVATALDRGKDAPAKEENDDNDEGHESGALSSAEVVNEIAKYLGINAFPLAGVLQGVKELGSTLQDCMERAGIHVGFCAHYGCDKKQGAGLNGHCEEHR